MEQAHDARVPLLMTVINAGELWYGVARSRSLKEADENVLKELGDLGIQLINVDWDLTRQAAAFKTRGRIAYADCFAAALAKKYDAPLVTGDPEFKSFESEISVLWV